MHWREGVLAIVLAAIFAAVMIFAWLDVPELSPMPSLREAPETLPTESPTTAFSDFEIPTISLNTATAEELMTLDGLGEKTAKAILEYRRLYGGFDSVEELLHVEGVGEKKLEQWRAYLTV